MNKLQLRNLIREEIRNVLRTRKRVVVNEATLSPIGKKLRKVHAEFYENGDEGLDWVQGAMMDAKLDDVYSKWLEEEPITPQQEKALLKAMTDALDDFNF